MKLDFRNLIETPSRSRLGTPTKNAAAGTPEEDRLGKTLLRQMQQFRQGMESLSTFTRSTKQASTNKAGLLKQRLDMLKEMLRHASPEAAKSLARELKSIAQELASLAKSLGGTSASSVPTTEDSSEDSVSETISAEIDSAAMTPTSEDLDSAPTGDEEIAASDNTTPPSDKKPGTSLESADGDVDEEALRALLQKARALLKELMNQIKAKIAAGDKEARRDLEAAAKNLAELDQTLADGPQSSTYTARGISGVTSLGSGLSLTSGLSGISIDTNA